MSETVAVLGVTGMLGSMILQVLAEETDWELVATVRKAEAALKGMKAFPNVAWVVVGAEDERFEELEGCSWVVNCVGRCKPFIDENDAESVEEGIVVNAVFPTRLARWAANDGAKVIHVTTDCVYSGSRGKPYSEADEHDARDVYGKTKSLGEAAGLVDGVSVLRVSVIGPETRSRKNLLEWFLAQKGKVGGYENHLWNGITTLAMARAVRGIIEEDVPLEPTQHLFAAGAVTKFELLGVLSRAYETGVEVVPTEAEDVVDRRLTTETPDAALAVWEAAGYAGVPAVEEMIGEMRAYEYGMDEVFA